MHYVARCESCGAVAFLVTLTGPDVPAWERRVAVNPRSLRLEPLVGDWRTLRYVECACRRQPTLLEV